MDDEDPLIHYEIDFRKKPHLLGTGIGDLGNEASFGNVYEGVTERLEDHIEWEPHVDEADRLDYIVAVSSGVLSGLIDAFYVGGFSLERASEWGQEKIEKVVIKVAHIEGYKGSDLKGAIGRLGKNHHFAADGNANDFGGGLQHHFRDFSHHFSIGGLFFSILTQFTGMAVGTNLAGNLIIRPIPESHRQLIGKNFQEKIAFGTIGWFFHMVSDMAGSGESLMGGTGIPGPLVSFMKEISALPFFKSSSDGGVGFRLWLTKLFNGTLLADRDENGRIIKDSVKKFDLRMEIGILGEIGRQTIPALINQCVVRGFYFCRRTCREIRELDIRNVGDLGRIAPEDVLPWGTPAMRRMVTVSTGVFAGVGIADATVRAIKSRELAAFFLRVNYVGVVTFVIACVVDIRATSSDRALEGVESAEEAYEHQLSDLGCLKLDFMQARILHSVEYAIVAYDIALEKHPKRASRKRAWLREWSEKVVDTVDLVWAADAGYFLTGDTIYESIRARVSSGGSDSWLWLVAMEAVMFRPYAPLHGENDRLYKGLKLGTDYLGDIFCDRHGIVDKEGLCHLDKIVSDCRGELDGVVVKRVVGAVGAVVVVAVTGGLAFYFAPAIAPVLAAALGLETAALSGAALTSASLAFLGGGALAAGGAGMAGGTMLIAGGGAIIGAVGGSSVSAATTMALATNGSYVLDECSKLVAFCEEVLIKRYEDLVSVVEIHRALNQRIVGLEVEIEAIKRGVPADEVPDTDDDADDSMDEISPKKMVKILNRSNKFLKRSSDRIAKALNAARKNGPALQSGK